MNDALKATLRELPDKPGCYLMRDRNSRIIYVGKATSLRRRVQSYFRASTLARAEPKLRSLINSVHSLEYIVVRNEAEALLTEGRLIKEYKPRYNVVFRDDKRYLALRAEHRLEIPRFTAVRIVRQDGNEYFGPFPSAQVVHVAKDFVERHYGIRKCNINLPDADTYKHCHNDIIAFCSAPCVRKISPEEYRAAFEEACAFLRGKRPEVLEALRGDMHSAAERQEYELAAQLRDTVRALEELIRHRAQELPRPELRRDVAGLGIEELASLLRLPNPPEVIECFDISHLGGTMTVAGMVVAVGGRPARSRYRHFRIRTIEGVDDPGSVAEVVRRRYERLIKEKQAPPDLILIDGGITQLRAARSVLEELGLRVPSIGIAERLEEIVIDDGNPSLILGRDSAALMVLMRLRDEAHRFAIAYNRNLRARAVRESVLDEIPGIGPHRKQRLLRKFGSVRRIANAGIEEFAEAGIGENLARAVLDHLNNSALAPTKTR